MKTIADVIAELETIVADCRQSQNPAGYFATLYLQMTQAVKNSIEAGAFQDPARMEKLDVLFANRYIQAYRQFTAGKPCTQSWQAAFYAANTGSYAVIQHILGGINAHINLDLGIAAAQTSPGSAIHQLQADFNQINVVIGALASQFQEKLNSISWPMRMLDNIGGNGDEAVLNFSIGIARKAAWQVATDLAALPETEHENYIQKIDKRTALLASKLYNPGWVAGILLGTIRFFEPSPVSKVLDKLA